MCCALCAGRLHYAIGAVDLTYEATQTTLFSDGDKWVLKYNGTWSQVRRQQLRQEPKPVVQLVLSYHFIFGGWGEIIQTKFGLVRAR